MPIDLLSLQKRGATITVEFYDMTSEIEYDPIQFTPSFRTQYNLEARKQADERRALFDAAVQNAKDGKDVAAPTPVDIAQGNVRLLCKLVKSWDINGLDGKKLPVEEDAILEALPESLVNHIISEVWSDVNSLGKSKTSKPLEDGSAATAS